MSAVLQQKKSVKVDKIRCPNPACGHLIYDGEVIRSRCVKLHEAKALCRCKQWVEILVQCSFWQ